MTYRDRRLAKADRLEGWAELRRTRAAADLAAEPSYVHDWAWITQPGLDRSKENRRTERRFESLNKADSMASRADGIRAQVDGAIYSDDPDAIEQLEAKIAGLEAKREKVKAHNKEMRKPAACDHPADCDCRSMFPRDCGCSRHPLPGYVLQNLGGNITRNRQRLEQLKREQANRSADVEAETETADGATVRFTAARVEIEHPAKPSYEARQELKAHGFRWDRVAMCWQAPVSYARAADYARALVARAELSTLEAAFEEAGGRGVEMAERIDTLRAELGEVARSC